MRVFTTLTGVETAENQVIEISVGEGNQTFKWLAMTIEARIKQFKLLRKTFSQDCVVVVGIKNEHGELVDPADKLQEHCLNDNLKVSAEILEQLSSDEYGNPILNEWLSAAYLRSEEGKRWNTESTAWRERLGKIRQSTKAVELPSHRLIHIGEFDVGDAAAAFDLDWGQINWMNLGFSKGDPQKKAIYDSLKANYVLICNFFQHFVGSGRVGERYGLTVNEFGHMLHYCRLVNFREHTEKVEKLFIDCTGNGESPLMSRNNLVEALIKYCVDECKEKPTIDALEEIMFGQERPGLRSMSDVWSQLSGSYLAYSSTDVRVEETFLHFYHSVKEAFYLWSGKASKFGPCLKLDDFSHMMLTSNLTTASHDLMCMNSFMKAQMDPARIWELDELGKYYYSPSVMDWYRKNHFCL